jgi:hypothetical protein
VTREELVALRDAIDTMLKWLTPERARPNGHDPDPGHDPDSMTTITPKASEPESRSRGKAATPAQAAERRLVAAMRSTPRPASTAWPG